MNKHGKNHTTEILFETNNKKELSRVGKWFSKEFNVVEDPNWANLCPENGWGGKTVETPWNKGKNLSFETRMKMSSARKKRKYQPMQGKLHTKEAKERIGLAQKGKFKSEEHKRKIGNALKGRIYSAEYKLKQSISHLGKKHTDQTKQKISLALKRRRTVC